MNIHQLSVTYLAEQDRVLLRVNTTAGEEVRLWLTRRLMQGLWPLLNRLLTSHLLKLEAAGFSLDAAGHELRKMLADFRKDEFLQNADFDTPYQDQLVQLLGGAPLLVTDVDASPLPDGRLRLVFNERAGKESDQPRRFQMEMAPQLMQGLMHLLEQALDQAQWRAAFEMPLALDDSPPDEEAAARRRYLN